MALYDYPIKTLSGEDTSLRQYEGKTLLIVNVASQCGLTPQYTGLEELHEKYADHAFEVLGFPCNQFGEQEPGSSDEIAQFCSVNYGISFPMFEKVEVNGPGRHPIFAELEEATDADGHTGEVRWNFEKFLVGPSGNVIGRFGPLVTPDDDKLVEAIETHLPA